MKELSYLLMELVGAPVNELKTLLTQSFERLESGRGTARCALSGGATALIFLGALRSANVDWRKITLFWADERAVPPDDPDSNYGLAERMLLSPLGAKAPRAIRMPADASNLGQAALWYDDALATELDNGSLDLAILGVGEDGHVCSLFPGHHGADAERSARGGDRGCAEAAAAAVVVDAEICAADEEDLGDRDWAEKAAGASGGDQQDEQLDAVGSADAAGKRCDGVHRPDNRERIR